MVSKKHSITLPQLLTDYIKEENINLSHFVQEKLKERMRLQGITVAKKIIG